jgi:hypothetical protein
MKQDLTTKAESLFTQAKELHAKGKFKASRTIKQAALKVQKKADKQERKEELAPME